MFKLLRYFSITSALAIVVVTAALAFAYWQNAIDGLTRQIEDQNVKLAQSFSNVIWARFEDYINSVSGLDGDALRARSETEEIHTNLKAMSVGLPVLKVKIFNMRGLTIYSSELSEIGAIENEDKEFKATVVWQTPTSKSSFRDVFRSFDGDVNDRHLIESYLPIKGEQGHKLKMEGVFELYTDVTKQISHIRQNTMIVVVYLLFGLGALYSVLFLTVRRADRIMKLQYTDLQHEIAERQSAEQRYKQARDAAETANKAKSEFLASMSHDLRTPLNAIMGFSDMMRTRAFGPLGDTHYDEYASDIYESGALLVDMINDVLDLSKIEAGKFELFEENLEISSLIGISLRQLEQMAERSHQTVSVDVAADMPKLLGDERAIVQILNNLLSNAIKFTPDGGKIAISAVEDENGGIVLSVSDTGLGMSEEGIEMALKPFEQAADAQSRRHKGTGLGLHISTNFMKLLGGTLEIQSEIAKGTTVALLFPPERTVSQP